MNVLSPTGLHLAVLVAVIGTMAVWARAGGGWETEARELPDWAQRGRMIHLRTGGGEVRPEYTQWRPLLHFHGAAYSAPNSIAERKARRIPTSVRVEAVMFFGTDAILQRIAKKYGQPVAHVEHTWYWQHSWFLRDPKFRRAALRRRDGEMMIEYYGNSVTERKMGNPLSPMLHRMRREQSEAVLTPRQDSASPRNRFYPKHPYGVEKYGFNWDDLGLRMRGRSEPLYYPLFGHLAMLWYDNPNLWADFSHASRRAWEQHFAERFGRAVPAPARHPDDRVRREWTRFWIDAYGDYFELYYRAHQKNIQKTAVPETARALDGSLHCVVGLNASPVSFLWGDAWLYLFAHRKVSDYPGMLVEYPTWYSHGKRAPLIKTAMAAMHGRPTGGAWTRQTVEAECLACNGTNAYTHIERSARGRAYIQFQFDNRRLLTNALQGNRIGVLYNTRSGLVTDTLIGHYEMCEQLDRLGASYDVLVEKDLAADAAEFLGRYEAVLVPGGEYNATEIAGLRRYAEGGGHLVLIGDVRVEPTQYGELPDGPPQPGPWHTPEPVAGAFGQARFADADLTAGAGRVTVREDQVLAQAELAKILKDDLPKTWRLAEAHGGLVTANVLRQPRAGDARIVGLVNYTGRDQRNVRLLLPAGFEAASAVAVSPDGYADTLRVADGAVSAGHLHNYAMIVLGPKSATDAALAAVQPKVEALRKLQEKLGTVEWKSPLARQTLPQDVPAGQQLARVRGGSYPDATAFCADATAPRRAQAGRPFTVRLKVLGAPVFGRGSNKRYEYMRLRLVNVETGREVTTQPNGAPAPIDGVALQVAGAPDKAVPIRGDELAGTTLAAEVAVEQPGRYQAFVDYVFHDTVMHGTLGPRVKPRFPGDRPEAGWGTGRHRKIYVKHRLPRLVIDVQR